MSALPNRVGIAYINGIWVDNHRACNRANCLAAQTWTHPERRVAGNTVPRGLVQFGFCRLLQSSSFWRRPWQLPGRAASVPAHATVSAVLTADLRAPTPGQISLQLLLCAHLPADGAAAWRCSAYMAPHAAEHPHGKAGGQPGLGAWVDVALRRLCWQCLRRTGPTCALSRGLLRLCLRLPWLSLTRDPAWQPRRAAAAQQELLCSACMQHATCIS